MVDAAEAILAAAEKYDGPEPINLGNGREISIRELATTIGRLMGYTGTFTFDPTKPNGQPRRALAVERAANLLGWRASTSLEDGLQKTIAWWRSQ